MSPAGAKQERDPVCGMEVDAKERTFSSKHEGKNYVFCSKSCKDEFDADPEAYVEAAEAGEES